MSCTPFEPRPPSSVHSLKRYTSFSLPFYASTYVPWLRNARTQVRETVYWSITGERDRDPGRYRVFCWTLFWVRWGRLSIRLSQVVSSRNKKHIIVRGYFFKGSEKSVYERNLLSDFTFVFFFLSWSKTYIRSCAECSKNMRTWRQFWHSLYLEDHCPPLLLVTLI